MEFGHVYESLENIDFRLPPETAMTSQVLNSQMNGQFKAYVGASKWGEKSWLGNFYPNKTPDNAFLPIYAQNFNTVEFGPTFYNLYSAEEITKWARQVAAAPNFKFCPKFPQTITHIRRLTNAQDATAKFYQSLAGLGNHLGPLLLQLGENFTPKSFPQLKAYLAALPPTIKVHVEVRHKDWFGTPSNREDLLGTLREHNTGTVISDTSGRRDCVHMELTTKQAVIRFAGNDLHTTDYARIDAWVERLKAWKDKGLETAYIFMHQNNERHAPEACDYLIRQLNTHLQTQIPRPKFLNDTLF